MRFAQHKDDKAHPLVTSLFNNRDASASISEAIQALTAKISQSDNSSLGTIESDINKLAASLKKNNQRNHPVRQTSDNTLETSLRDIIEHIGQADQIGTSSLHALEDQLGQMREPTSDSRGKTITLAGLEQQVSALTNHIAQVEQQSSQTAPSSIEDNIVGLANELARTRDNSSSSAQQTGLGLLEAALSNISQQSSPPPAAELDTSFKTIETSLEKLSRTLDNTLGQSKPNPQVNDLEKRVASLDAVMAKIQASRNDRTHLQNFETQLGELSQRLQSTEQRSSNFQTIETDIANLFAAVRQNRSLSEQQIEAQNNTSAQISLITGLEQQIKALQSSNRSNETQARDTLGAVHNNLEKITARLSSLEQSNLETMAQAALPIVQTPPAATIEAPIEIPVQAPPQIEPVNEEKVLLANVLASAAKQNVAELQNIRAPKASISSPPSTQPFPATTPDVLGELILEKAAPIESSAPIAPATPVAPVTSSAPDNSADTGHDNFIASARRAAQKFAETTQADERDRSFGNAIKTLYTASPDQTSAADNQNISSKRRPLLVAAAVLIAIGLAASYNFTEGVLAPGHNTQSKVIASNTKPAKPNTKVAALKIPAPIKTVSAPARVQMAAKPATAVQVSQINRPVAAAPQTTASIPTTPKRIAPQGPPVSSVGPRMGREYKLMDPTGRWSVGQIVHSVRQRHARQIAASHARQIQTGSIPPAQKSTRVTQHATALNSARQTPSSTQVQPRPVRAITSRVKGPLPPQAIGPKALRVAAASGNAAAQFEVAVRFGEGKLVTQNYSKSAAWYQQAAAKGLAPAQYRLGTLYEKGRGVPLDKSAARIWYERAAEKGNIKAMHNLAVIYANGGDIKPNFQKAALWFRKAAELGLTDSQYNLGILTERGLGLPKNQTEGYKWFSIAARNGDTEAKKRKALLEKTLTPQMLVKAKLAAQSWEPSPVVAIANSVPAPAGGWDKLLKPAQALALSQRQMVSEAQALLNKLGFRAGPADGVMGQQTRDAIRNFQSGNNMTATGTVSPILIERLRTVTG